MALTPAQLIALIAADLPDNTTGLITPAILRTVLDEMVNSIGLSTGAIQTVTSGGTVTILATTTLLIFNKSAPTASPCNLGSALLRDMLPLEIYDFTGLAGDITLTPFGTEKIMGDTTPWVIGSGGAAQTGGSAKMVSLSSIAGWLIR